MRINDDQKRSSIYTGIGYAIDQLAANDYVRDGYLLSPRTILKGRDKRAATISRPKVLDPEIIADRVMKGLLELFKEVKGRSVAVMYSGGFDSTFVGRLAQQQGANVTAVTVKFDNFNANTVRDSARLAKRYDMGHHVVNVTSSDFVLAFESLAGVLDEPIFLPELAVVYAALSKYDAKVSGNVFISGMGCDQWFGNGALEPVRGGLPARLDWAMINTSAHQKMAQGFGCRFIFPFLSTQMLELSLAIPDALKKNKKLLRSLAVVNALPARGAKGEMQIPQLMNKALIKYYGDRAWPGPVANNERVHDEVMRRIFLGLWLEKIKERPDIFRGDEDAVTRPYSRIN